VPFEVLTLILSQSADSRDVLIGDAPDDSDVQHLAICPDRLVEGPEI